MRNDSKSQRVTNAKFGANLNYGHYDCLGVAYGSSVQ